LEPRVVTPSIPTRKRVKPCRCTVGCCSGRTDFSLMAQWAIATHRTFAVAGRRAAVGRRFAACNCEPPPPRRRVGAGDEMPPASARLDPWRRFQVCIGISKSLNASSRQMQGGGPPMRATSRGCRAAPRKAGRPVGVDPSRRNPHLRSHPCQRGSRICGAHMQGGASPPASAAQRLDSGKLPQFHRADLSVTPAQTARKSYVCSETKSLRNDGSRRVTTRTDSTGSANCKTAFGSVRVIRTMGR
jgi:hypothetical protein